MQPNPRKPLRLWIRQGAQQKRVHHAEDSRISPYADTQGRQNHQSRQRILTKRTPGIAQVLYPSVHSPPVVRSRPRPRRVVTALEINGTSSAKVPLPSNSARLDEPHLRQRIPSAKKKRAHCQRKNKTVILRLSDEDGRRTLTLT